VGGGSEKVLIVFFFFFFFFADHILILRLKVVKKDASGIFVSLGIIIVEESRGLCVCVSHGTPIQIEWTTGMFSLCPFCLLRVNRWAGVFLKALLFLLLIDFNVCRILFDARTGLFTSI